MKYKVTKVSFFPADEIYAHPVMHLPVDWTVEIEGEIEHLCGSIKLTFLDHNKMELPQGPFETTLSHGGKNLAFCVKLGEGAHPGIVKLYTEAPVPDGFFGPREAIESDAN